jgi:hypothetical protein
MTRDRKAALAASIQSEREATQARVPRFDKFEKAEAALSRPEKPTAARVGKPTAAVATRPASVREVSSLEKVTRDSFTMPSSDYEKIGQLRAKCLKAGLSVTKSEIIRAGLHALESLSVEHLWEVIGALEKVKTGRPGRI